MSEYTNLPTAMLNIISSKLKVNEIFYSISGEGLSVGQPATFIRMAGCNLAINGFPCRYCDTPYSQQLSQGKMMTCQEIVDEVKKYPTEHIVITGGEPLIQENFYKLVALLTFFNYKMEVETNGSVLVSKDALCRWSLDIKTPSSGNELTNQYKNLERLRETDQVKFVIGDREDFIFARTILDTHNTDATILLQPSWGKLSSQELVEWIKKETPYARLSLQLHKIIYGNKRGV